MSKETYLSTSVDETLEIASNFINNLKDLNVNIFLNGDLGAGKTQFVKGIFSKLGLKKVPTSPTYDLIQTYEYEGLKINHLDLYRIEVLDLEDEIWINQILEEDSLNIIEWGNKFDFAKGDKINILINILIIDENDRKIEISID